MSASDLRDLFDEHTAIAGQAARLAAERAAPYTVRRLFALTDQLDAATTLGTGSVPTAGSRSRSPSRRSRLGWRAGRRTFRPRWPG